jgi:predicted nucleic acid-binding protein
MAIKLDITLYDASYLALEVEAPLITADMELYEKGKNISKVIHASKVMF